MSNQIMKTYIVTGGNKGLGFSIAAELANEYETDIDRVNLSLARLLEELEKEGLIIVDGSTR